MTGIIPKRTRIKDWHYVAFIWLVVFVYLYFEKWWLVDAFVQQHYWLVNVIMGLSMFVFMFYLIKYFVGFGEDKGWWGDDK